MLHSKKDCNVCSLKYRIDIESGIFKNEMMWRVARVRRRARNTSGGRCSFTRSYLDSFDDLRAVRVWYLIKNLFYVTPFKLIRNGNRLSDRSSLYEFKDIFVIHIPFYGRA